MDRLRGRGAVREGTRPLHPLRQRRRRRRVRRAAVRCGQGQGRPGHRDDARHRHRHRAHQRRRAHRQLRVRPPGDRGARRRVPRLVRRQGARRPVVEALGEAPAEVLLDARSAALPRALRRRRRGLEAVRGVPPAARPAGGHHPRDAPQQRRHHRRRDPGRAESVALGPSRAYLVETGVPGPNFRPGTPVLISDARRSRARPASGGVGRRDGRRGPG
ncbi:hypothetical protein CURTO8I2_90018 [Curtobacterium sp. 8I-2]|nr:hypothetical protein CURTO8I2_90018 [Curtobacterium sp. 8I-2]